MPSTVAHDPHDAATLPALAASPDPAPPQARSAAPAGLVLASTAVLTACGAAGDALLADGTPAADIPGAPGAGAAPGAAPAAPGTLAPAGVPAAPTSVPLPPFDTKAASRLLGQASFGATKAEIVRTQSMGLDAWLAEQFAMPRGQTRVDWLFVQGRGMPSGANSRVEANHMAWQSLLGRPDQLRQRMVYALSQIMVVSASTVGTSWPNFACANYLDVLETHAFGSFRALLEAVTLTPAMGTYLSMRGSQKADSSGRQPDENYAREILQLFSIGLVALERNGTPTRVAGATVETYDGDDVSGLARVFTGWDLANSLDNTTPARAIAPMVHTVSRHETGEKRFLGVVIRAGTRGPESLQIALDAIVAHPNVGPFIGAQLIQRLVCANPSPDYVGRVAAVFANNGANVRGDLRAVLQAVLTDPEARWPATAAGGGKLREPVLRFAQWARAFGVTSPSGKWLLGSMADPATRLGQSPLMSASVFNFYRPGYVPPGTQLATAGLVAPEMQITTESSVAGYLNCMQTAIASTTGFFGSDLRVDYTSLLALADSPQALIDELNLVLAAGQLGTASQSTLRTAITAMTTGSDANRLNRVRAAVLMVLACPEYLVQK